MINFYDEFMRFSRRRFVTISRSAESTSLMTVLEITSWPSMCRIEVSRVCAISNPTYYVYLDRPFNGFMSITDQVSQDDAKKAFDYMDNYLRKKKKCKEAGFIERFFR